MKRQLQGIALILCSIFLILFSQFAPWFPIPGFHDTDLAAYGSIVVVIMGLVRIFKDELNKYIDELDKSKYDPDKSEDDPDKQA